ncbi:hypothetical protein WR25_05228 [Diploscapter pachys]|uniref:Uncharacterized protein n=1 Tax=Diploscapter pachys TaxID=2018661 RepID=A0A2A2LPY0_9BILA|nr:hypothetical protein WR25_05228 [Diploscapter pachys]
MPQSRQAMRDLLSKAEFADSDCLKLCTKSLLNCLQRFPNDKEDIYNCIGRNHGVQVHAIVTELLDLEPVFEPQERPIDDVFYIAKLILVLNGASVYEPITALLPKYVVRHYFFLRSSSPNLVEPIKAIDENGKNNLVNVLAPKLKSAEEIDKQTQENAELMERTYERLRETETELHSANRNNLRRLISQDVNAIAEFNSLLSGSCRFVASLCSICASCDTLTQIVLCGTNDELADIGYLVEEEQRNLLNVEHQFSHIPPEMSSFLIECRFFIRLLAACAKLGCDPNSYAEVLDEIADELEIARAGWSQCQCSTSSNGVSLSNAIEQHISAGDSLAEVDNKKILTFQTLSGYLNKYSPIMPNAVPDIPKIQAKWAEVIEPNKDRALETVVKFVAGLPRSIPIIAQLHNLTEADLAHLHIMIEYPDETVSYYRPRNSEFERKPDQHLTILNTKAMLSSPRSWLSSAEIRLMFVLLLPEPIKSALTPVPLFDSPTKARFASVRLRMLPSDYVTEMDIRLKERIHRNQQLTQTHAYEDLIAYYRHQFPHNDERCQNSSEMEKLHFDIVAMYEEERQPKEEFLAKMKFRQDLYDAIKEYTEFEEFEIYPSGSSITSMGTRNSDLDLTLVCPMAERFYKNEQDDKAARSEGSFNVLRIVRAILLGTKYSQLVQSVEFVCGNIPILKMVTREGLECDLAFTSDPFVSSLHNSHLLRHYCLLDERFAQLTALVKKWASATGVKNPKGGGFNSYGLTLLVLHFMHCGVYPPVLPNLQNAFAGGQVNPEFIDFSASLSDVSPQHFSKGCQREKNYDLVSTLFVKFLFYYANFDFKLNYIDIPAATRRERNSATYRRDYMTRDEKGHTGHVVCIQDPFDGHNPGRTVRHLDAIKLIFNKTLELFISGNVPALQQIISMRRFNE